MNIEIERKFLVRKDEWKTLPKPPGILVRQGYLLAEPAKTIRVRTKGQHGYLAIKGISTGARRDEFEYEIPLDDAHELFENFSITSLSKVRFEILFQGKTWEVDEFLDDNEGLIMAEIELENESEQFELPHWIEKEVTGDERYYNSYLSVNPFKKW